MSAEGTPYTASILLDQNGEFWGGVIGGVVLLALAVAVLGIIWKMCSTRRKHHATAGNDTLNRQQRRTLIKSAKFGEFTEYPASLHFTSTLSPTGDGLVC